MTRPTASPAVKAAATRVTEADLQRAVMDMCAVFGLLCWHDNDSRRNTAGLPDLVIVGKRVIWRELKSQRGRIRLEQQRWISRLTAAGADAAVWRPMDLLDGTVQETLRGLRW